MNRKQRRAAGKQDRRPSDRATSSADPGLLFRQAVLHQQQGHGDDAIRLYTRLLAAVPDNAEAQNNLACVLLEQGKAKEAAARFQRLLTLRPQLCDDFGSIEKLLADVNPALLETNKRVAEAWPNHLPSFGLSELSGIATDVLLRHVLRSTPIRSVDLERLLTAIRRSLLDRALTAGADDRIGDDLLDFCGALAQQCFINEYVFATTAEEAEQAGQLRERLIKTAAEPSGRPLMLLVVAMYFPLHTLPGVQSLLGRAWPKPATDVLTQQVAEPQQERQLRDSIPRLTVIDDAVSLQVQQQYEENPYPRWVHTASAAPVTTINQHLRAAFPSVPFRPLDKDGLDILVAGCGTGRHPIEIARIYENSRVLAVDLSLSSLCYARRKTPSDVGGRIEYAQADILKLDTLDRSFDMIDSSGVLHHMADPFAAWRTLLTLLRPNGFFRVGLYSEIARRNKSINAARTFVAERGYRATIEDIRRCRQDLLNLPLTSVATAGDFFSTSECRDMLFHVQERQLTIPDIKSFIEANGLTFIGFEFKPPAQLHYRSLFSNFGWSMTDLNRWHDFETKNPDTFTMMYQFWVQKP